MASSGGRGTNSLGQNSNLVRLPRLSNSNIIIRPGTRNNNNITNSNSNNNNTMEMEGEIKPKKLPNPCKESKDRVELHRELLFNQKIGKSVLNQKSELERAIEKMKAKRQDNQMEDQSSDDNNALEFKKVLDKRAKAIEQNRYYVDGGGEDQKSDHHNIPKK